MLGLAIAVCPSVARAQAAAPAPLLDALSITVANEATSVGRGTMRFRIVRTGTDVELLATGIVVRGGLRVTSEWHGDTTAALRRYISETRDSTNRIIDRIQVTSSGGRVTLERVTSQRRMVREFLAQRDLMILDTLALVPFVVLAQLPARSSDMPLLDVRRGELTPTPVLAGPRAELAVAEVMLSGTPMSTTGLRTPVTWWRDARGRLLRVVYGLGGRLMRDDPPT